MSTRSIDEFDVESIASLYSKQINLTGDDQATRMHSISILFLACMSVELEERRDLIHHVIEFREVLDGDGEGECIY